MEPVTLDGLTIYTPAGREDWLALRKQFVTATDWPKIQGTSKYGSARDVLLDKKGLGEELPDSVYLRVGKKMEPIIKARLMGMVGPAWKVEFQDPQFLARGVCGCTPDLTLRGDSGTRKHFEMKVSMDPWKETPAGYVDQVKFQLALLGERRGAIVHATLKESWQDAERALDDGTYELLDSQVEILEVTLGEDEGQEILDKAEAWWNAHIEMDLPLAAPDRPIWNGTVENDNLVRSYLVALQDLKSAKAMVKNAEGDVERLQAEMTEALGEAKVLTGAGGSIDRSWVKGKTTVDNAAILRGVKQLIPEDKQADLDALVTACTKAGNGYTKWTIKEGV